MRVGISTRTPEGKTFLIFQGPLSYEEKKRDSLTIGEVSPFRNIGLKSNSLQRLERSGIGCCWISLRVLRGCNAIYEMSIQWCSEMALCCMGCECATILDISGKCLYSHRALNDESMKHAQDSFVGKIMSSKQSNNLMTNILTQPAESHECLHY